MNIYYLVLAQILRHFFTALAGVLLTVGVTVEMQNELVETTVTIIVPILLLLLSQGWSFFQKRYLPLLFKTALQAPPTETVKFVRWMAKQKTRTPVVY